MSPQQEAGVRKWLVDIKSPGTSLKFFLLPPKPFLMGPVLYKRQKLTLPSCARRRWARKWSKENPDNERTTRSCWDIGRLHASHSLGCLQPWSRDPGMTRGVFKVRAHLPPPPKLKGSDQFPQKIQSSESTETAMGCKWKSLWQQFASPFVYLRLHLFPSFSHPGA